MTTTVEARGVLCPVPIIRLARAAAELPPGALIELLSDDPATEHDVPAWCRLRGHALVSVETIPPDFAVYGIDSSDVDSVHSNDQREPHVPNPSPGQGLRHLIRLGGTAARSSEPSKG